MNVLTEKQTNVLATHVAEKLAKLHEAKIESVKETDEYKNFETDYKDEIANNLRTLTIKEKHLNKELDAIEKTVEKLAKKHKLQKPNQGYNYAWSGMPFNNVETAKQALKAYLKKKKGETFKLEEFNQHTIMSKIEADILLSDVKDLEQLVKDLIEKYK